MLHILEEKNKETKPPEIFFPAQCRCGHLFLEKFQFVNVTDEGFIGFCWCGFCKTKYMVKP